MKIVSNLFNNLLAFLMTIALILFSLGIIAVQAIVVLFSILYLTLANAWNKVLEILMNFKI